MSWQIISKFRKYFLARFLSRSFNLLRNYFLGICLISYSSCYLLTGFEFANASLEIPTSLSRSDRQNALEILGLSSAPKLLSNPYPLGGYSGVEVGFGNEVISTSEISRLGSRSRSQNETSYSIVTIGKGLYNNIDVFCQFTPFSQGEQIWNYGGQIRWGFYQAEFLPAHLSLIGGANSVSFQNLINISTTTYDLVAGFTVDDVTLYVGGGGLTSRGTFLGGASGVTDSGRNEDDAVSDSHFLSGVDVKFSNIFIALQLDKYAQSTYSAKFGFRF